MKPTLPLPGHRLKIPQKSPDWNLGFFIYKKMAMKDQMIGRKCLEPWVGDFS